MKNRLSVGLAVGALLVAMVPAVAVANGNGPADKVTVCHVKGNGDIIEINVSANAQDAHFRHGDVLCSSQGAISEEVGNPSVRYRSFANTGGDEVYIGLHDLGIAGNRVDADNYTWSAGTHPIVFSYDSGSNTLSTKIDGSVVSSGSPPIGGFCSWNALEILVLVRDSGATVNLNNVEIDGIPAGSFSGGSSFADGTWTVPYPFGSDFTVTADLQLSAPGTFSTSQENSKAQFIVGCQ